MRKHTRLTWLFLLVSLDACNPPGVVVDHQNPSRSHRAVQHTPVSEEELSRNRRNANRDAARVQAARERPMRGAKVARPIKPPKGGKWS